LRGPYRQQYIVPLNLNQKSAQKNPKIDRT
jgi:hypothetical protein